MSTSSEIRKSEKIHGRSFDETYTVDDLGRVFSPQPLYMVTEGAFERLSRPTGKMKSLENTSWGVAITFLLIGVAKSLWSRFKDGAVPQDPTIEYVVVGLAVFLGFILQVASRYWQSDRYKELNLMKKYFDSFKD